MGVLQACALLFFADFTDRKNWFRYVCGMGKGKERNIVFLKILFGKNLDGLNFYIGISYTTYLVNSIRFFVSKKLKFSCLSLPD